MNDSQVRVLVQEILDEVAPGADLTGIAEDADLRRSLDLDSLDFLNFVVALDERTGLQTREQDYPQLTTIAGCSGYLGAHGVSA